MDYINNFLILKRLHKVIEKGRTGSLTRLAERMHMPKSTLSRKMDDLTALGAEIEYDRSTCSFHYLNNFTLETAFRPTRHRQTNSWFECRIRYEKTLENGMSKKVTEPYLIDALGFTEAESRIAEEVEPFISGEFAVSDIKRVNYAEVFPDQTGKANRWFKCKLVFITPDEKSGKEKRTASLALVQAADLRDAVKKLDEGKKGTMADYQIVSVNETAIMDVYYYKEEK